MKKLEIYEFQAKRIEDTLRLVANLLKSHSRETSLDRDIMQSYKMIQNVLSGDIDKPVPRIVENLKDCSVVEKVPMTIKLFEARLASLRERCFHMNDEEASKEVDIWIKDTLDLIGFDYFGVIVTREWLIENS